MLAPPDQAVAVEASESARAQDLTAKCPRHAGERVVSSCTRCGDYVCLMCAQYGVLGEAYCPPCAPPKALPSATLQRRFVGHFVDVVLFYGSAAVGMILERELSGEHPLVGAGLFAGGVAAVNLFLIRRQGQSVGKLLAGTRLVTKHDQPVALWRLLLRLPIFGLGLIDIVFLLGEAQRALHDRTAGTRVVTAAGSRDVYATSLSTRADK